MTAAQTAEVVAMTPQQAAARAIRRLRDAGQKHAILTMDAMHATMAGEEIRAGNLRRQIAEVTHDVTVWRLVAELAIRLVDVDEPVPDELVTLFGSGS